MATKQVTRNIALTPYFDDFVQSKVESGRYQSASEVVREGLRLLEQRDHRLNTLREEIELGWQQTQRGEVVDGPSVFAEIERLSKARRKAAKTNR